uniref:Uncharacterized protein n=1 Tax=Oryza brachyantha TaxID=4533 RepID=J3N9Q7_ORYBR
MVSSIFAVELNVCIHAYTLCTFYLFTSCLYIDLNAPCLYLIALNLILRTTWRSI